MCFRAEELRLVFFLIKVVILFNKSSLTAFTYLTALALPSLFLLICLYIRTISSNLLTVHNLHLRTTQEERNPGYLRPKRKQSVIQ